MKVEKLMHTPVHACQSGDPLAKAAAIMWQNDCGCVPVVDERNHVIGMLTDRDICMATWMQGKPIHEIPVSVPMSREVFTCRDTDELDAAERTMRDQRVRRLPVIDKQDRLVGVLSLHDLVRHSGRAKEAGAAIPDAQIRETLAAVSRPRAR